MLPNAQLAFIDIAKISNYCLSLTHPEGRHKARVFQAVLGLDAKDAEFLKQAILSAASGNQATKTDTDQYGTRYILDFELSNNERSAMIRTGWIIRSKEDFPRLTTCYVL